MFISWLANLKYSSNGYENEERVEWWNPKWRSNKMAQMRSVRQKRRANLNTNQRVNSAEELALRLINMVQLSDVKEAASDQRSFSDEQKADIEEAVAQAQMQCRFYKTSTRKFVLVVSNELLPRFHPHYGKHVKCPWPVNSETVDGVKILLHDFHNTGLIDYVRRRLRGYQWWEERRGRQELDTFEQHAIVGSEEHEEIEEEEQYEITEKSRRMQQYEADRRNSPDAQKMIEIRKQLPAWAQQDEIIEAVKKNQVVLVSGATGCGKTTQIPQFVLEQQIKEGRGSETFMVCTQPRRISALSVAERVAQERGESVGGTVGYQIRLEDISSTRTQLLFCTTGVLLRKLQNDPTLKGISHVVIDEIHERNKNEDFILYPPLMIVLVLEQIFVVLLYF
eukprot:TRINITY_DN17195_c0_g1_i4.p1 TRINITY_DN17195_c0_g1~~TRINITY_DN17195_c0_g1_i4.p1  ORF type:complete len:394 (-),score=58.26 TRINITY_DN17195_c0_g1_i4:14-1195(-)